MSSAAAQYHAVTVPGIWRRFSRHRPALGSAALLVLMIVAAAASLPWTIHWHDVHDLQRAVRHPPAARPVVSFGPYLSVKECEGPCVAPASSRCKHELEARGTPLSTDRHAAALPDPAAASFPARALFRTTSWLGHDDLGRSLLFRLLPGFLISLLIGLAAAAIAVVVGTAWGAIAGLAGGRLDLLMMRVVDVLYGLPYILLVIVLQVGLAKPLRSLFGGPSSIADLAVLLAAIGGVSWLTMARVVRGQVLSLRTQLFVDAARVAGAGWWHVLRRHILPNLTGPIAVYATLIVPQAILQESFLSFLGIGIRQPTPSLGRLAADGVEAVNAYVDFWWLLLFPCAVLTLTLLALNFLGDALRDALDPRSTAATVA